MQSLTHHLQTFIANHGLQAVFVLMVLESACIPVPSEVTMIYAGYLVSQGSMNFVAAVIVGTLGNLVGSWIAWAAGAYGVDAWLMRTEHNRRRVALGARLVRALRHADGVLRPAAARRAHLHLAPGGRRPDAARCASPC